MQKSAGKFLASIFWAQDGILWIDFLPKGQTINAEYYSSLLVQLKDILKEKRRGNVTGCVVLTRQSPCSQDICNPEETGLPGLPVSWSPTLFSDLAPSGYHLFPGLKKQLKVAFFVRRVGHCYRGDLGGRTNFWIFLSGLQKLEHRAKKCMELRGEYVV